MDLRRFESLRRFNSLFVAVTVSVFVSWGCGADHRDETDAKNQVTRDEEEPPDRGVGDAEKEPQTTDEREVDEDPVDSNIQTLVECSSAIDSIEEPLAGYTTLFDVVAVDGATESSSPLSVHERPDADSLRYWAKTGLLVRSGSSVTLAVPPEWRDDVAIGWGLPEPVAEVEVPACGGLAGQTGWHAYAGGFWVSEPACVPLDIRHDGEVQTIHVGVGAPCEGQEP